MGDRVGNPTPDPNCEDWALIEALVRKEYDERGTVDLQRLSAIYPTRMPEIQDFVLGFLIDEGPNPDPGSLEEDVMADLIDEIMTSDEPLTDIDRYIRPEDVPS
jgi:hypothetical protein